MKKGQLLLAAVLTAAVLCCTFVPTAHAKDLEPCYHCGSTGQFRCNSCNNAGEVVCDLCGGTGGGTCPGEEGKGPCSSGYYTCPSCSGSGVYWNGDAVGGTCGQCLGAGKLECWLCHGAGRATCNRCGGAGKQECQSHDCKAARAVGWKCPYCMGAGYLLTNFWPGENDGRQNLPVNGDKIWVNGKSTTYSGGNGNGGGQGSSGSQQSQTPEPDVPAEQPDDPPADFPLPQDRNSDFDIPAAEGGSDAGSARVVTGRMNESESSYYASLPEETLAEILSDVQKIVGSAAPGRSDAALDDLLQQIAEKSGFASPEDGGLFPICFEGHRDVGFPVRVTVSLEPGALDGGRELYAYHVASDGTVEALGEAEYDTHEDGSVSSLSFYTTSFSSFFTAAGKVILPYSELEDAVISDTETTGAHSSGLPLPVLIVLIAAAAAAVLIPVSLAVKRRNTQG